MAIDVFSGRPRAGIAVSGAILLLSILVARVSPELSCAGIIGVSCVLARCANLLTVQVLYAGAAVASLFLSGKPETAIIFLAAYLALWMIAIPPESERSDRRALLHDIRTPLNGMTGMIEIIGMRSRDKEIARYVEIAKGSADILTKLLDDESEREDRMPRRFRDDVSSFEKEAARFL